ncbi:MAG TPA: alpha/beta hydrolase [Candidatus Binatia bacterium]|nr:alpha/beta hydrolase [Candidatus Binatia bacterium]
MQPHERTIDIRGLPLHYLEWGQAAREPLVLVHGFLDQARSWQPFVTAFEKRLKQPLWIVAPDCRGHGDSGWVGAGGYYHFPDYVLDLECVIQDLGVTKFKLVGHSMGGTISFLYAGTFPDRVTQLALIEGIGPLGMNFSDAPARMEKWIGEVRERGRNHFREYPSVEAGAMQLQHTNPRLSRALALDLAERGMKPTPNGTWVWKFDPLHRTPSPQPFYSGQAMEFLRRIECPVLVIEGKLSHHTARPDKQLRLNAIAHHALIQIENAGHMVHHDNPEGLATALARFFQA